MKTILVDAMNTFVIENQGIFREMQNLLDKYPNRKIILTNANDEQMKKFGLIDLPYELFTLKHNPDKTNPEYFEKFLKDFRLDRNDVLYFEHNEEAVKIAKLVGINTYHYNKEHKDLNSLKYFLDQNL